MTRSFSSLSPAEALQAAIAIEQRNAEVYHRFAEMFTQFGDEESLEIASVFWEMAVEERGHRALLEEKYVQAFGQLAAPVTENSLCELIEVPRLDKPDIFANTEGVAARERALHIALQAEVTAQQFYEKLVEQTPDGPLCDLYKDLAKMEDGHATYLGTKLADRSAGSVTSIH